MFQLVGDVAVLTIVGGLLVVVVLVRRKVTSGLGRWMLNVFATFCLFFLVFAVSNIAAFVLGRDPSRTQGGEWSFGVVYGAVSIGWFTWSYIREGPERLRQALLTSGVAVAVIAATLVNVANSPIR
jgi:hypothetical protein